MNTTQRSGIMQRWFVIQHELMPELRNEVGALTPKLEHVIRTLEWVRIEEFVVSTWRGCGVRNMIAGFGCGAIASRSVRVITLLFLAVRAILSLILIKVRLRLDSGAKLCWMSMDDISCNYQDKQ